MAQPQLSIFTGGKTLGNVFTEEVQLVTKFVEFNIPGTQAQGNTALNLGGKTMLIIVQGVQKGTAFDGVTVDQRLADYVYEMNQWVNAPIQTSRVYTTSLGDSYDVVCHDFTYKRMLEGQNQLVWSLLLKVV